MSTFGVFLTSILLAGAAMADDDPHLQRCNQALVRGQELQRERRLLEARAEYGTCIEPACDPALRQVCERFLTTLATRLPSVHIAVRGRVRDGTLTGRVWLDGAPVESERAFEVNPGEHTIRAEAPGHRTTEQRLTILEGTHPSVVLELSSLTGPAETSVGADRAPPRSHALTFALGGAGVAALGGFTYFGLTGRAQEADLRRSCPQGTCDTSSMRASYLAADVSLAVAAVALGVMAWLVLHHGKVADR